MLLLFASIFLGELRYDISSYTFITPNAFAVTTKGQVWWLDDSAIIHIYDERGKKVGEHGGVGAGPGLFQHPDHLYSTGKHMVVEDMNSVSLFDEEGQFLKKVPKRRFSHTVSLQKLKEGWVVYSLDNYYEGQRFIKWFSDDTFTQETLLSTWKQEPRPRPSYKGQTIYPLSDVFFFATNREDWLCFCLPGDVEIQTYQLPSFKKGSILLKRLSRPFDPEWAEQLFSGKIYKQKHLTLVSPEYLPEIKSMSMSPFGDLVVERFGNSLTKTKALVFRRDGGLVENSFPAEPGRQVLWVSDQYAYILTYESVAEVYGMVRVEKKDLEQFIAKNRIDRTTP